MEKIIVQLMQQYNISEDAAIQLAKVMYPPRRAELDEYYQERRESDNTMAGQGAPPRADVTRGKFDPGEAPRQVGPYAAQHRAQVGRTPPSGLAAFRTGSPSGPVNPTPEQSARLVTDDLSWVDLARLMRGGSY